MTQKSAQDMVAANAAIWEHYLHACELHPTFAPDGICTGNCDWKGVATARALLNDDNDLKTFADDLLSEEIAEIYAAYCDNDIRHARYEIFDAIAVLLRMDDMLAGMQERGER